MIKAEPYTSDKTDHPAIKVEFEYPPFLQKHEQMTIMHLELVAILHAISKEYSPKVVELALEHYIASLKKSD